VNDGVDQRRLSAILAADVVGYTRLMEQDTEGTVAAWKSARRDIIDPAIAGHSGRIVKHTGDGFLVEFATVQDAVQCAIAMQQGLAENSLEFRMGVNMGDVIDDGDDIHGEGVNIAARIEALADPGGICISGMVHDSVRNQLDLRVEDMGAVEIKHVSEPVQVYRLLAEGQASKASKVIQKTLLTPLHLGVVAATLLVALAGGWWWQFSQNTFSDPATKASVQREKPSIAVLPFNNMSQDKSEDYFVDGMTEDLITDLSKVSGLIVIARNSTFAYKGQSVKVQDVGRDLGASHVLEGSARRVGNRVRINAQLVSTDDGRHLWAERYDRELTDIFALQDEVTRNIVAALAVKLTGVEQTRLETHREANPEAYDALLQGLEFLYRYTPETTLQAREFFKQAVAFDPTYARAHSNIAFTYVSEFIVGRVTGLEETMKRAQKYAAVAQALDPTSGQVHMIKSVIHMWEKDLTRAETSIRTSLSLAPNYADAYAQLASVLTYKNSANGNPEKGLQAIRTAKRLNPLFTFFYLVQEGRAYFQMRQYERSALVFEQVIERNPHFLLGRLYLAASYAHLTRLDDANWEIQEVLTLSPKISLEYEEAQAPFQSPSDLQHFVEGLRLAGLPE